jgi:hypothetical protein
MKRKSGKDEKKNMLFMMIVFNFRLIIMNNMQLAKNLKIS